MENNASKSLISAMQGIAVDAINRAGQGHIGMAIGAAPITYTLIGQILNIAKEEPKWINRDRFVLSAGHGSMAQYSIMHFMGLLSIDDMKNHKQWNAKTSSHPEIDKFSFVDASTGPLGQGIAMAVGMAISQEYLKKKFNKKNYAIIDHHIFALHGDGCLQEGVALEAIQLAGTKNLSSLILIHDFNNIQIDSTATEVNNIDLINFFKAQNFEVIIIEKPLPELIKAGIEKAKNHQKPTYIQIKTKIATNTIFENTSQGHNGTLNEKDTIIFKQKLGLKSWKPFKYDHKVYAEAQKLWINKNENYKIWKNILANYAKDYPKDYANLKAIYHQNIKYNFLDLPLAEKDVATRNYLIPIMAYLESQINIIGGAADLAAATKIKFLNNLEKGGKNIQYGIREFSMSAINNGIYLHAHLRTIDATFLVFSDYAKAAYRLGALQKIPSVHILTHDSYQVGGDGPTHQPIEQLTMLRSLPGMKVIRPADGFEMRGAMQYAFDNQNYQIAIIACRQPIKSLNLIKKLPSAYVVINHQNFDVSLLASGSEVQLAMEVSQKLRQHNIKARVISVPILQDLIEDLKLVKKLLLRDKPLFAIEASNDSMWYQLSKYSKFEAFLAQNFGESAPGEEVYQKNGFNVENIYQKIIKFLN